MLECWNLFQFSPLLGAVCGACLAASSCRDTSKSSWLAGFSMLAIMPGSSHLFRKRFSSQFPAGFVLVENQLFMLETFVNFIM